MLNPFLFFTRLNHCIMPYVMLDENATIKPAMLRSIIDAVGINTIVLCRRPITIIACGVFF